MDFTYNIEQYLLENETKDKIRGNIERLKNENVLVNNEIDNQISFSSNLYKLLGIIDENNNLSMYGKLVANLTNCSEILLGKLIASNFFAKLDNKTIVIILSLLIDDRGEEEYDYKKYLNKDENDAINHVLDFNDEIDYAYQEVKIDSNINLSSSFIVPIKWWYEKKEFVEIIRLYNNFDGNFVKNIFKIRDICQEIIKISEIFMMGELLEKMNEILNVIIYDLCEFNSLYIHHYDLVKKITEKK